MKKTIIAAKQRQWACECDGVLLLTFAGKAMGIAASKPKKTFPQLTWWYGQDLCQPGNVGKNLVRETDTQITEFLCS